MQTNPAMVVKGACSWFGGPNDNGMSMDEGLALISGPLSIHPKFRNLFIPGLNPAMGLGRQLNPAIFYCAMRWDYSIYSQQDLRNAAVKVSAANGLSVWATPVDWGPAAKTGRVIDLSMGAVVALGVSTDSVVTAELYL